MPQILFIQGAGDTTHDQWDNRLVASMTQALGDGYSIRYPRMPDAGDPTYPAWKAAILIELDDLSDGAVLIGHSIGATLLLHTLADAQPALTPAALVLIAPPFIGDGGWPNDDIPKYADLTQRLPSGLPVLIYRGSADETVPAAHMQLYATALPQAVIRSLPDRDHQLDNDLNEITQDIRSL